MTILTAKLTAVWEGCGGLGPAVGSESEGLGWNLVLLQSSVGKSLSLYEPLSPHL